MPERPIIADSGPLISLARVGLLSLLPGLFGVVRIPETVMREVTQGAAEGRAGAADVRAATWIEVVQVDPVAMAGYELLVDAGEAAAIALAKAEGGLLFLARPPPAPQAGRASRAIAVLISAGAPVEDPVAYALHRRSNIRISISVRHRGVGDPGERLYCMSAPAPGRFGDVRLSLG